MSELPIHVESVGESGDDFVELVVRHLEGRLEPSERERLNAFLAEDSDKRDTFVALCTHACLLASYIDADATDSVFPSNQGLAPLPPSPALGFLGGAWSGAIGYFSQIGPLSYLIATVLFGLGLAESSARSAFVLF